MFFCAMFFLMTRRPPRPTRTDTLFPYTTLFRSKVVEHVGEAIPLVGGVGSLVREALQASRLERLQEAENRALVLPEAVHGGRQRGHRCGMQRIQPYRNRGDLFTIGRSEEQTPETQSLMRYPYAVICSTKTITTYNNKQ